jgi:integrase
LPLSLGRPLACDRAQRPDELNAIGWRELLELEGEAFELLHGGVRSQRGVVCELRSPFNRFVWRPAVEQVGLDGLRVHDLRHTAATLAAAAGATTKELMDRMGHTSPAVALRYQHVMADRQAQLASALNDLARSTTGPAKGTARAPKGTQRARRRR